MPVYSITTPTTVVNQAYNTSGNGGRKLVRLNNGTLVALTFQPNGSPNKYLLYKSTDNGVTWSPICSISDSTYAIGTNPSLAYIGGTKVVVLGWSVSSPTVKVSSWTIDVSTQADVNIYNNQTVIDTTGLTTASGGTSISYSASDNSLHAAWSCKSDTYPNSFNIRYAKGTIDGNGNVTWGSVEQVTKGNNINKDITNPCIVVKNDGNPVIIAQSQEIYNIMPDGTTSNNNNARAIHALYFTGSAWSYANIFRTADATTTPQSNPCAVVDNIGVIHVVWHGTDSSIPSFNNIRYSKSADGGATWSAATKLTNVSSVQMYPSITVDKDNKLYVLWAGTDSAVSGSYTNIRKVVYDGSAWGSISTLTNNTTANANHPSTCANYTDFTDPLVIYQDNQASAVKFRGTWAIPPTDPSGVTVDKSSYNVGDTITINFTGSTDPDGDAITYSADIYDGSAWISLGTGFAGSPITATIPIMGNTSGAKVRVRAVDAGGASSGNAESATFTVLQRPGQIIYPVTVVAQPYDTSGNGGRKLVRLSNGWLVAGVIDTSTGKAYFYKSTDNGSAWSQVCFITPVAASIKNLALVANGTSVKALYSLDSVNTNADAVALSIFDPTSQSNVDIYPSRITVDSGQSAVDKVSLAIAPDGTLHAAWASKNSTYPNSFNIRYSKGTDGGQTWAAPTQITTHNTNGYEAKNPCIVVKANGTPVIVYDFNYSGSNNRILCRTFNGSTWSSDAYIYDGVSYAQSSPCAVVDNAGVIHVVWYGLDSVDTGYHNVRYSKSIDGGVTWSSAQKITTGNTSPSNIHPSLTVNKNNQLFCYWTGSGTTYGLKYAENLSGTWSAPQTLTNSTGNTHPSTLYDKNMDFSSPLVIYRMPDDSTVKFLGVWPVNQPPTITLTSPPDGQALSEGNTLSMMGTASDPDVNDTVTIYCRINGGAARAINAGLSDGSTPIPFTKTLTFTNKRLYDGAVDVTGADLAEGTQHTLYVWAEDNKGGVSPLATRTFTVIWNRPPTISGTDTDLGVIGDPPSLTYSVSDPEGQSFTITEYLDGEVLRTFSGVAGQEYTVTIPTDKWLRTSLAQHTLKVRATDSAGQYSERIYTFTRTDDRIVFELDEPFLTDAKANRILVTLDAVIPPGASYIVEACNNAFDAQPTWEDVTGPVSAGRGYIFTNETKTAANWGVSIRFTFLKGTATEKILINGFGGAFD
jgi:hypothetical protein